MLKYLVVLVWLARGGFGKELEMKMIKNFLDIQNEPCVITSFLCWSKSDLMRLQMMFSEQNYLSVVHQKTIGKFTVPHGEGNLFIMDLRCGNSQDVLQKANVLRLFTMSSKWLIFTEETTPEYLKNIFIDTENLIESRVILAEKTSDEKFTLSYAYKIIKTSPIILQDFGIWTSQKGFHSHNTLSVFYQRRNLHRTTLRTALIYTVPDTLKHLEDYRFGNVDTQLKLNYFLVHYLFHWLNASMELSWERAWGEYVGNNTYSGLLGRIHRNEIDLGGSPLFCVKERLGIFDCIAMTTPAKSFFLFKKPPLSYVANIFTLPFETDLWLSDIVFLGICTVLLYLAVTWEWKVLSDENQDPPLDMLSDNLWDSFMFTIGAVCQQGYPDEPKSASGRIIIFTLCLTMIFMFTAFSANTVVLFQSSANNIKTLEDLYNSKIEMGVTDMLYYRFWFAHTYEPTRRKIYLERIAPKNEKPKFYPLEYGIDRLRNNYFAFYTDMVTGYKVISDTYEDHEKCGLAKIEYLEVRDPWVTTPKRSIFRELFYIGYKIMEERGIRARETRKLYSYIPECSGQGSNFRSAGILDLYSVYMLYFIGLASSFGLLILEIITKHYLEPRMTKGIKRIILNEKGDEMNQNGRNMNGNNGLKKF